MNKTKLRYFLPALTLLLSFSVLKAQKEECVVCLDKFYMFDHILTLKKQNIIKKPTQKPSNHLREITKG